MDNLPYNLTLLPGVRTDHKGRPYQIGRYPSGKSVTVYIENNLDVPAARLIPVPIETRPMLKAKLMTTGVVKEPFKPFIPRRLHVIECRKNGNKQIEKYVAENGKQINADRLWNVLWISPDQGQTWKPVNGFFFDYHVQYHIDEKEPSNG